MRHAGFVLFFIANTILIINYTFYAVDVELMTKASESNDFTELEYVMAMNSRLDLAMLIVGLSGLILIGISIFKKPKVEFQ